MESKSFTLAVSPLKVAGGILAIVLVIGANFLWTSIGSLKSQVAEQKNQLEEAKKQNQARQDDIAKVVSVICGLAPQVCQQPQAQQPQSQPQQQPNK